MRKNGLNWFAIRPWGWEGAERRLPLFRASGSLQQGTRGEPPASMHDKGRQKRGWPIAGSVTFPIALTILAKGRQGRTVRPPTWSDMTLNHDSQSAFLTPRVSTSSALLSKSHRLIILQKLCPTHCPTRSILSLSQNA